MTEENRRWGRVLAGAVLGCATGISALLLYTNGLFVAGLARDFGLTRTQFGFGVLLVTLALAAANPLVGWAVDRFSARVPAVVGLVLLSVRLRRDGRCSSYSVNGYLLIQAVVAFVGAASGPIAYTKIIGATFDKNRGVALGVTMTRHRYFSGGIPPALAWIISDHGWRAGFFSLARGAARGGACDRVADSTSELRVPTAGAQRRPRGFVKHRSRVESHRPRRGLAERRSSGRRTTHRRRFAGRRSRGRRTTPTQIFCGPYPRGPRRKHVYSSRADICGGASHSGAIPRGAGYVHPCSG